MYRNERETGQTIIKFLSSSANTDGLKRDDIHFTSKLASNSSYSTVRKSIQKSVETCGLGYIDLFLLHSPYGGKSARLESWRAVEDAIDAGEVRTGGVSNYGVKHVRETAVIRVEGLTSTAARTNRLETTRNACGQSDRDSSVQ